MAVSVCQPRPSRSPVLRVIWKALAACGKPRLASTVQILIDRVSRLPCPRSMRLAVGPRQPTELVAQARLVGPDRENEIGTAPMQIVGMGALHVPRIGRDNTAGHLDAVEKFGEHGSLVCLRGHIDLVEHDRIVVADRCHDMSTPARRILDKSHCRRCASRHL